MTNAITTRRWSPTNGRPARIVAECGKKKAVRVWNPIMTEEENHRFSALALAQTMRIYSPDMTTARQKDGVFVHVIA